MAAGEALKRPAGPGEAPADRPRRGARQPEDDGAARALPPYNYLLALGPGRSGSTYLYRLLNARAGFVAPSIKEGSYYRSPRRFARALARIGDGAVLLDVANLAWRDPALARVEALRGLGHRPLVVVLLRRHRARAASMIAFRRSRVVPWRLLGARRLHRAVLADMLTPAALERIFALDADVLTIGFEALTQAPRSVLECIARICATPPIPVPATGPVNASVAARSAAAVAVAKVAAVALRCVGAQRTLQSLKNRPALMHAFFRPLRPGERAPLDPADEAELERQYAACLAYVETTSERLAAGVWLRRRTRRGVRDDATAGLACDAAGCGALR